MLHEEQLQLWVARAAAGNGSVRGAIVRLLQSTSFVPSAHALVTVLAWMLNQGEFELLYDMSRKVRSVPLMLHPLGRSSRNRRRWRRSLSSFVWRGHAWPVLCMGALAASPATVIRSCKVQVVGTSHARA